MGYFFTCTLGGLTKAAARALISSREGVLPSTIQMRYRSVKVSPALIRARGKCPNRPYGRYAE